MPLRSVAQSGRLLTSKLSGVAMGNVYSDILTTLVDRETAILIELDQIREIKKALEKLAAVESSDAIKPPMGTPRTQTTIGPALVMPNLRISMERQTLASLAQRALTEAGKPLPLKVLLARVKALGGGKPGETIGKLRGSLVPTLLRRDDIFTNHRRGIYGLKAWELDEAIGV